MNIQHIIDKTAETIPGVCSLVYESGKTGIEFTQEAFDKFIELFLEELNDEKHFDFPEVTEDFNPREEIERLQEEIREIIEEEPQNTYDRSEFKASKDLEQHVEEAVKSKRINWNPYGNQDLRSSPIKRDF